MRDRICPAPAAVLRELILYDAATGALRWKMRGAHHFKKSWQADRWNRRYASQPIERVTSYGYVRFKVFGEMCFAHRAAWAIHFGEWPSSDLDHINGDRADNRIENLRMVSVQENGRNRKLNQNNKSGCPGVYFTGNRWRSRIKVDGRWTEIGSFRSKDEAIAARKEQEQRIGFHPNHGRSI